MKQSDDPKAFFDKFQFNSSITMKHPESREPMAFEGWEAKYVNELEWKVKELERYVKMQMEKIDWLMNRDFYMFKDKLDSKGKSNKGSD